MNAVEEIEYPSSKKKFVCCQHKLDYCTHCLMDFRLLNDLRYDKNVSSSNDIAGYLKSCVTDFYQQTAGTGIPVRDDCDLHPRSFSLMEPLLGNMRETACSLHKMVECLSYMTFGARNTTLKHSKMFCEILTALIAPLQSSDAVTIENKKQEMDLQEKSGEPETINEEYEKIFEMIDPPPLIIRRILHDNGIAELGGFLVRVKKASIAINEHNLKLDAAKKAHEEHGQHPPIELSRDVTKTLIVWQEHIVSQTKGVIPKDDPANWDIADIVKLLNLHGMRLVPFPQRNVLNAIAKELIKLRLGCKKLLEIQPESMSLKKLRVQAKMMGISNDEINNATVDQFKAPAKIVASPTLAEPQIAADFRLGDLSTWRLPYLENAFSFKRQQHIVRFHQKTISAVLVFADKVAATWDKKQKDPDRDFVDKFKFEENKESSEDRNFIAIRPVELWSYTIPSSDETNNNTKIPLLGVEYIHTSEQSIGQNSIQHYNQGLQTDSEIQSSPYYGGEETMNMFLSLLKGNRHQLDRDDPAFKTFRRKTPKGWKFSVLRPADPIKWSGIMKCPECGKAATKTCSRCKTVAYCSKECQKVQWKMHKKVCKVYSEE